MIYPIWAMACGSPVQIDENALLGTAAPPRRERDTMAAAARSAALLEHLSELGCTQAAAIRPERLAWLFDDSADSGAGSGVIELLDAIVAKVGPQNSLVCSLTQPQREAYERLRASASSPSSSSSPSAASPSLAGSGSATSEPLLGGDELAAAEDALRDMAPQLVELEDEATTRRAAIAALREKRHALDTRLSAVRARNHTLAERAKKLDGQVPAARNEAENAAALVRETSTTLDEALQQITRRVDDVLRDSLGRLQEGEGEGDDHASGGGGKGAGRGKAAEEDEPSRSPQFLSLGGDLRRYLRLEDAHTREINAYVNTVLRPKPSGASGGGPANGGADGGHDAATTQAQTTVRWQLKSAALEQPRWLHELDVEALGKHGSSAAAGRYDFHCVELYRLCEDQRPKSEAALLEARTELARARATAASVTRRVDEQRALAQLAPHELAARLASAQRSLGALREQVRTLVGESDLVGSEEEGECKVGAEAGAGQVESEDDADGAVLPRLRARVGRLEATSILVGDYAGKLARQVRKKRTDVCVCVRVCFSGLVLPYAECYHQPLSRTRPNRPSKRSQPTIQKPRVFFPPRGATGGADFTAAAGAARGVGSADTARPVAGTAAS